MASSVTLEFELAEDEIVRELGLRRERRNSLLITLGMLVAAFVCFALYRWDSRPRMYLPALLLLAYALGTLFYAVVFLPRKAKAEVRRLTGAARVKFADDGVRFGGAHTTKGFSWPNVRAVFDQPASWLVVTNRKDTGYVIPKSSVAQDEAEQFAGQLKEWAGKAYKVRRR
jgi:hypothetical protein